MPVKLLLKFRCSKPVRVSLLKPKTIHGLFFSLLSKEDGELFHKPSVKPFSLFFPVYFRSPERELSSFSVELNLLKNDLFPIVSRSLFLKNSGSFNVEGVEVELFSVRPVGLETYEGFLEKYTSVKDIVLDFTTPVLFKKGSYDYILPEPYLIFKNLLRRFNRFSPIKISPETLRIIKESVVVSGCWIKTKKVEFMKGAKITGFMGRVYLYSYCTDKEFLRNLGALLAFSQFSGVGRKTTMGFGKTFFVSRIGNLYR